MLSLVNISRTKSSFPMLMHAVQQNSVCTGRQLLNAGISEDGITY